MKMYNRQCSTCGIWFERSQRGDPEKYPNAYCSNECMAEGKRTVSKLKYKCEQCGAFYVPKKTEQRFCSHSCAAIFNNLGGLSGRPRRLNHPCPRCGVPVNRDRQIYCSVDCRSQHQIERWLSGKINPTTKWCSVPTFIRRYMLELSGHKCSKCSWAEINLVLGRPPLEIDHIDGNCSNNAFKNLQVLCPNCHSLTPNYRSLNGESKRVLKRKRNQNNATIRRIEEKTDGF